MKVKLIYLVLFLLLCVSCNNGSDLFGKYISEDGLETLELLPSGSFTYSATESSNSTLYGLGSYHILGGDSLMLDYEVYNDPGSSTVEALPFDSTATDFQFNVFDHQDYTMMPIAFIYNAEDVNNKKTLNATNNKGWLVIPRAELIGDKAIEFGFFGYYRIKISSEEIFNSNTNSFLVRLEPDTIQGISHESMVFYRVINHDSISVLQNQSGTLSKSN